MKKRNQMIEFMLFEQKPTSPFKISSKQLI